MATRLERLRKRAEERCLRTCAWLVVRCRRPRFVGVTGSVGKTTTKEAIAAVLCAPAAQARLGLVWKSEANLNDNTGIPWVLLGFRRRPQTRREAWWRFCTMPFRTLALCTVRRYPRLFVLEYGAGWGGDVGRNALLAPPEVGVVTAIGPAHLARFRTIERVVEEKSALVRNVPRTGLVVLGADNRHAASMDSMTSAPVVKVPGRGRTLSENVARAVGRHFGLTDDVIEQALASFEGVQGRQHIERHGPIVVMDDSYNANPLSMAFAIDTLVELRSDCTRKVAILGSMFELGPDSRDYHEQIGAYARERVDLLVGVGDLAKNYQPDRWFASSAQCVQALQAFVQPGDRVLVKGSHSLHLDEVAAALRTLGARMEVQTALSA